MYAKNPTTYMVKHITIFLLALIVHTQIFVALGHAQNFLDMYGNSFSPLWVILRYILNLGVEKRPHVQF